MSIALLLLPDFLLIALGWGLRRLSPFGEVFWGGVDRLIYYLLFPALLFRSLVRLPPLDASWISLGAVALAFTLAGMLIGLAGRVLPGFSRQQFAACYQCGFRFNTYIALAVAARTEGEAGLAGISFLIGLLVPVVNLGAVGVLAHAHGARLLRELLRNPLVLACAAAFAWRTAGWQLPDPMLRVLELLASAALPLGLLTVGAGLILQSAVLPWFAILFWNGLKLGMLPAIAWGLAWAVGLSGLPLRLAVLMAAVPTATSAYVLAMRLGGQGAPVAVLISSGTLLAMVTLPAWLLALR